MVIFWLPPLNGPYIEGDDIQNFDIMDVLLPPIKSKYRTCYRNQSAGNMGKHYSIHITTDTWQALLPSASGRRKAKSLYQDYDGRPEEKDVLD